MSKLHLDFDLPDFANEKTDIFIVGGKEVLARWVRDHWEVKTGRCSRCGRCCHTTTPDNSYYDPETGTCQFLRLEPGQKDKYLCMNPDEPWDCVKGNGYPDPNCTVRFERV